MSVNSMSSWRHQGNLKRSIYKQLRKNRHSSYISFVLIVLLIANLNVSIAKRSVRKSSPLRHNNKVLSASERTMSSSQTSRRIRSSQKKRRILKGSGKSKGGSMGKSKKSKSKVNNIFVHDEDDPAGTDGDTHDESYYPPEKVPLQPVICGEEQSLKSALLVRMVGRPSLLTRYEKLLLEEVVVDSYNEWMLSTCDGYHRAIDSVQLLPIDELPVTDAHQETVMQAQASSSRGADVGESARLRRLADTIDDTDPMYRNPHTTKSNYYYDPNLHFRPLYWISVSATCRDCLLTEQGNFNLLASHAVHDPTYSVHHARDTTTYLASLESRQNKTGLNFTASNLETANVCFCPLQNETQRSNLTFNSSGNSNNTSDPSIDLFLPAASAPTSEDLLVIVNRKILFLREQGRIFHLEQLVQLTEPDYAYDAQNQMYEEGGPNEDEQSLFNYSIAWNATDNTTFNATAMLLPESNMTWSTNNSNISNITTQTDPLQSNRTSEDKKTTTLPPLVKTTAPEGIERIKDEVSETSAAFESDNTAGSSSGFSFRTLYNHPDGGSYLGKTLLFAAILGIPFF